MNGAFRVLIVLAGLFGAAGVALAAMSAHQGDPARLGPASAMLLFHAPAILAAILLCERGLIGRVPGLLAACGFALGAALFAGDLVLRHFGDRGLFPMAAPSGGALLIASWLVLAVCAAWPRRGVRP
jgi:uncharacterized membrane protein YgdD (TMEM256/DUF423 family)